MEDNEYMNKRYNNAIHIFFSDYLAWLLIVSVLFVISLVATIAFGNANGFIWIIPVLFLVIYCLSLPLLILYCKAKKDIKNRNIEQITIKFFKIEQDDTFGFKNRGGAAVGKRKYRIIDENGNYYLLSTANEKDMFFMFHFNPSFSIEIEFLKTSRMVLHMKIIDEPKTNKKVRVKKYNTTSDFRKIFGHYL
ncbi:MAG: hypothetical protein IJ303_02255 [Clostridia bacterium]|nr:hypothetical protein [Clostridia bacterium]